MDQGCGEVLDERHKTNMLHEGQWRPSTQGPKNVRGYHLSALYSPWVSWAQLAVEFLKAHKDPVLLQTFVTTRLVES